MPRRRPMQLMLTLERQNPVCPMTHKLPDLVQALADLLLEALGTRTSPSLSAQEANDELQDHA